MPMPPPPPDLDLTASLAPSRRDTVAWADRQGDTAVERLIDYLTHNRLRSVATLWGLSMITLITFQSRRPTPWQLKIVESRVYAQGITVGGVLALVGLEGVAKNVRRKGEEEA